MKEEFKPEPGKQPDRKPSPNESFHMDIFQKRFFEELPKRLFDGDVRISKKNNSTSIYDTKTDKLLFFQDDSRFSNVMENEDIEDTYISVDGKNEKVPQEVYYLIQGIQKEYSLPKVYFTAVTPGTYEMRNSETNKIEFIITLQKIGNGRFSYDVSRPQNKSTR